MCRLYCMRSNYPRKVECELIGAQNALIVQSLQDERGMSNPDGWGLASYRNGEPCVDRQIEPAYADEAFRWAAASVHACDVMAHVRRGTVGGLRLENTHPFVHGSWMLAHNGTVGAFEAIRGRLLETMAPAPRAAGRDSGRYGQRASLSVPALASGAGGRGAPGGSSGPGSPPDQRLVPRGGPGPRAGSERTVDRRPGAGRLQAQPFPVVCRAGIRPPVRGVQRRASRRGRPGQRVPGSCRRL